MRPAYYNPETYKDCVNVHAETECANNECANKFIVKDGLVFFSWGEDDRRTYYTFCSLHCLFDAIVPSPDISH